MADMLAPRVAGALLSVTDTPGPDLVVSVSAGAFVARENYFRGQQGEGSYVFHKVFRGRSHKGLVRLTPYSTYSAYFF